MRATGGDDSRRTNGAGNQRRRCYMDMVMQGLEMDISLRTQHTMARDGGNALHEVPAPEV